LLSTLYARDVWRKIFYSITKPILFVVTPDVEGQAHNIKRKNPEAWVEIFKNSGHALFVDESNRFNSLLKKFLKEKVWKK
jgi:pimeloyl-ACP methyl ester carboxylesterase